LPAPVGMDTSEMFATRGSGLEELRGWGWALGLGIALMILGLLALSAAPAFTVGAVTAIGLIMIAGGVVQIAHAIRANRWKGVLLHLAAGLLYFVVGLMLVVYPLMGAATITLLLGSFFVVAGSFRTIGAIMVRFGSWGWSVASGVITLALGILILAQWPIASLWFIGTLLGVDLLFSGAAWVAMGLGARRYLTRTAPAAT
jgi:uncharacterized membrane protein HdeD (DUF308 family)